MGVWRSGSAYGFYLDGLGSIPGATTKLTLRGENGDH